MNILPPPFPPPNCTPGGGGIVLQGGGGKKKFLRASRAFLSYFHNIWEIIPPSPLQNFLDPPMIIVSVSLSACHFVLWFLQIESPILLPERILFEFCSKLGPKNLYPCKIDRASF